MANRKKRTKVPVVENKESTTVDITKDKAKQPVTDLNIILDPTLNSIFELAKTTDTIIVPSHSTNILSKIKI